MDRNVAILITFAVMLAVVAIQGLVSFATQSPAHVGDGNGQSLLNREDMSSSVVSAPAFTSIAGALARVSPDSPGSTTRLVIRFEVSGSPGFGASDSDEGDLKPRIDFIVITLDEDFQVPIALDLGSFHFPRGEGD